MKFWREVFSENGEGSFSRVISGFLVLSVVTWVTYLVFKNSQMPDLNGAALFITGGALGFYGSNKAAEILKK